jgi:hypothetical protein
VVGNVNHPLHGNETPGPDGRYRPEGS